jgi:glycosyltransferase involved in cell wall biosynthesis
MIGDRGDGDTAELERLRARERVLRRQVADLTAEVRDLQRQLATLAQAHDRLRSGDVDVLPSPVLPSPLPESGSPHDSAGPVAALRRAGKAAVRGTVGLVRRIWLAADPAQRYVVAPRLVSAPQGAIPAVSVVVDGAPATDREAILRELERQTASRVQVAFWDRATASVELHANDGERSWSASARDPEELATTLAGEYLLELAATARGLPSTLLEVLQWVVASEQLTFLRVFTRPVGDDGGAGLGADLLLCEKAIWRPGGVDLASLASAARARPVVGKTVGLVGPLDAVVPRLAPFGADSRMAVCRTGRFDVWAGNRAGPVEHRVGPVPVEKCAGGDRGRAVLAVLASPLGAGAAEALASIVRELAGTVHVVVAATSADHEGDVSRALALERVGATVYELGTSLLPDVWPSAVERIAARFRPVSVLAVGRDSRLDLVLAELRSRGVRLVAIPGGDGSAVKDADATLSAAGPDPSLWAGWPLPAGDGEIPGDSRARVRAELGVGADRWLVLAVIDLAPSGRPEDVVVAAHRLRDQPDMDFVIVGDGPLAGTVLDLAEFLGVRSLRLRRPVHALVDLVTAADVLLDPSYEAALRPAVAAALAVGTPVVSAPGGGAEELVEELGGGVVVRSLGDTDALVDAIRAVRKGGLQPDCVRAREVLASRNAAAARAAARALATAPGFAAEG